MNITVKMPKMRYCRAVFVPKGGGDKFNIDFGFYTQEQKHETLYKLRKSYSDHAFLSFYAIEAPDWAEPEPVWSDYVI
jgi:hypothetical protein